MIYEEAMSDKKRHSQKPDYEEDENEQEEQSRASSSHATGSDETLEGSANVPVNQATAAAAASEDEETDRPRKKTTKPYTNYFHELSTSGQEPGSRVVPRDRRAESRTESPNNLDVAKKENFASVKSAAYNSDREMQRQLAMDSRPDSARGRTLSPYNRDDSSKRQKLTDNQRNNLSPPSSLSESPQAKLPVTPPPNRLKTTKNEERYQKSVLHSQQEARNDLSYTGPPRTRQADGGENGGAAVNGGPAAAAAGGDGVNDQIGHVVPAAHDQNAQINAEEEGGHQDNDQQQLSPCVRRCRLVRFSFLIVTIFVLVCGVIFIPTWMFHISGPSRDRYIYTSLQDYIKLDTHVLTADALLLSTELVEPHGGIKDHFFNVSLQHGSCEEQKGINLNSNSCSRTANNFSHYFSQHVFNFGTAADLEIDVKVNRSLPYQVCFYLFDDYSKLAEFVKPENQPVKNDCGSASLPSKCSFPVSINQNTSTGGCNFRYYDDEYNITCVTPTCMTKPFLGAHYFVTKIVQDYNPFTEPLQVDFEFRYNTTGVLQPSDNVNQTIACSKQSTNYEYRCSVKYGNLFTLAKQKPCTFVRMYSSGISEDVYSSVLQLMLNEASRKDVIGYSVVVMAIPTFAILCAYFYWVPYDVLEKLRDCECHRTRRLYEMLT